MQSAEPIIFKAMSRSENLYPACTTSYIKQFQFSSWYSLFSKVALKATIIRPLNANFRDYLISDGIFVPDGSENYLAESTLSDSDSSSVNEEDESAKPTYLFPQLDEQIRAQIDTYGAVFPKLNWSSPKDASWVLPDLKCTSPADVYLLLKSSDFVLHDLDPNFVFEGCGDGDEEPASEPNENPLPSSSSPSSYELELVLKRWYDIDHGREFRCFVRENNFLGISQRDPNYYPTLNEETNLRNIPDIITSFWKNQICDKFPGGDSYIFDVYLNRALSSVYLMDFNPYHPKTDAILFTYEDLLGIFNDTQPLKAGGSNDVPETTQDSTQRPIYRIIDSPYHPNATKSAPTNQHNAVPYDILHLSAGKDIATFTDTWEEVLKQNVNNSMDDDNDESDG